MEAPCIGLLKCSQPGAAHVASTGPAEKRRGGKGPTSKICFHRSGYMERQGNYFLQKSVSFLVVATSASLKGRNLGLSSQIRFLRRC